MTVAATERVRSPSAARARMRITPRAAVLLILIAGLLFALVVPLRTYMAQRAQLGKLQRQEQVLQQQNAALQVQVQQLHDPAYLEQLARQCLGMVRPGEIGFTLAPKGGPSTTPAPPTGRAIC